MTTQTLTRPNDNLKAARESFSGRLLSGAQFDEAIAITKIVEREIHKSGTFKASSATTPMPSPAPRNSMR